MIVAALFSSLLSTSAFAPSPEFALYVQEQAKLNGVPLKWAEAVLSLESGGNVLATRWNPNGSVDRGPWQLNSASLPWFSKHFNDGQPINPYDQYVSTRVAIRYLRWLRDKTGSWRRAVMAYNVGPAAVMRGAVPQQAVWYAEQIQERMSL